MASHQSQYRIDTNHPSLPGHFPGNPVVPGVVIIDEILHALELWQPESRVQGFSSVKFLRPLLPEELFTIELQTTKAGRVKFECKKDQTLFATGLISLAPE